jgi:hypothetical protein
VPERKREREKERKREREKERKREREKERYKKGQHLGQVIFLCLTQFSSITTCMNISININ